MDPSPKRSTQSIFEDTAWYPAGLQACYRLFWSHLFLNPHTSAPFCKCPDCRCSSHHSAALQQEDNVVACLHVLPLRGNIQFTLGSILTLCRAVSPLEDIRAKIIWISYFECAELVILMVLRNYFKATNIDQELHSLFPRPDKIHFRRCDRHLMCPLTVPSDRDKNLSRQPIQKSEMFIILREKAWNNLQWG